MGNTVVRYLGVAAFDIRSPDGARLLIDPCLDRSLNPLCPLDTNDIDSLDLLLVSHGAADHLGEAVAILERTESILICDPAVARHVMNKGVPRSRIRLVAWGDVIEEKGIKIKALESKHVSFFKSSDGYLSGIPLGFAVYFESGLALYHPGDTALFGDMRMFGELYRPDIGLLPIGRVPGYTVHMGPKEAAIAASWLGVSVAIPMHYEIGTRDADEFREYAAVLAPHADVIVLTPGEGVEVAGREAARMIFQP